MLLSFFQNYFGADLTEDDYQNISHPYLEMYTHVTLKTIQIGTTFGTLLFGPLIAVARKDTRNIAGVVAKVSRAGKIGTAFGLVVGPLMTYQKFRDQSDDAVWDRAYRMRKNMSQLYCDRAYITGGVVGLTAAVVTKTNPVFCTLVGMSTGLIGMGVANNIPEKKK